MYNYATQRPRVFLPENVKRLQQLLRKLGPSGTLHRCGDLMVGYGDSWDMLAVVDFALESGLIRFVASGAVTQHDVYETV